MSMREYACEATGLVLSETEIIDYLKRKMMTDDELAVNDYESYFDDLENMWNAVESCSELVYFSEFTGESFLINRDGGLDYEEIDYLDYENVCVISLDRLPNLFQRAYESYDELIHLLKEKYDKYLSENFNYELHLRQVIGTVLG